LNEKQNEESENDNNQEVAFFGGQFKGKCQNCGATTLNDVKYVPSLCVNLFCLNKALNKGFKVSNDGVVISLTYKHVKLTFNRVIHATDCCVTGVLMEPILAITSTDFPMHQSAMKEVMISII
jgi:hypothetical protein